MKVLILILFLQSDYDKLINYFHSEKKLVVKRIFEILLKDELYGLSSEDFGLEKAELKKGYRIEKWKSYASHIVYVIYKPRHLIEFAKNPLHRAVPTNFKILFYHSGKIDTLEIKVIFGIDPIDGYNGFAGVEEDLRNLRKYIYSLPEEDF